MSAFTNPAPSPVEQPDKLAPVALPPVQKGGGAWKGWLLAALIAGGAWAGYEFGYKRSIAEKNAQNSIASIPTVKSVQGKLEVRARLFKGKTAVGNEFKVAGKKTDVPGLAGEILEEALKLVRE